MTNDGKLPDAVQFAIEHLLRTANDEKILIAGFAFGTDPMCISNFGTCVDAAELKLYRMLCGMTDEKVKDGQVVRLNIGRVA